MDLSPFGNHIFKYILLGKYTNWTAQTSKVCVVYIASRVGFLVKNFEYNHNQVKNQSRDYQK